MCQNDETPNKAPDLAQEKPLKDANKKARQVAVALGFDEAKNDVPTITAAGHGALAEKILQLAFEKGVKVREDADLAELLATVELNEDIPSEAIMAVAEILIQVYKANGELPEDYESRIEQITKTP